MNPQVVTVRLPDIGEGVVEGEVISWLKQEGDALLQDEPVVVVMTDKATVELPAPHPGILIKQYWRAGEIAIRDKPLYDIQLAATTRLIDDHKAQKEKDIEKETGSRASSSLVEACPHYTEANAISKNHQSHQESASPQGCVLATPKVRGLAKTLGINVEEITGTGKGGRIMAKDLAQEASHGVRSEAHKTPLLSLPEDEEQPLMGIRGLMARRMSEAHAVIPQFSYFEPVEATHLMQMREKFKGPASEQGIHLSYMPFLIKALSLTLHEFPLANACVDMPSLKIIVHRQHNIGIAMASPQGLIVPVLKHVEKMSLEEIIKAYEALKVKAASMKLTSSDMKEATITMTNFGGLDGGGVWATPMINYPEVAILGLARIRKEPVVRNEQVVARDILPLSWSFDHRIIDGELAVSISRFYHHLIRDPAALL